MRKPATCVEVAGNQERTWVATSLCGVDPDEATNADFLDSPEIGELHRKSGRLEESEPRRHV